MRFLTVKRFVKVILSIFQNEWAHNIATVMSYVQIWWRVLYQSPTLGAHTHVHGFWVGMGSILMFMGGYCFPCGYGWA